MLRYLTWNVVVNTPQSVPQALEIEERYQISFWDALILYAAQVSEARILYSEDLGHLQTFGLVQVINPFKNKA